MIGAPVCAVPVVEPLGFLAGEAAEAAVQAGLALPFQGGPAAFCLARLHLGSPGSPPGRPFAVGDAPPAARAMIQRLTDAVAPTGLPAGPLLMAILNATPDSFSDPGLHLDPLRAVAAGLAFASAGAAILDVGGESTRPGAEPPSLDTELDRVMPVISGLAGREVLLSVDTRRAAVMRAALDAGAHIVNDVSGLSHDPEAIPLLAERECPVVIMHSRGTPATMRGLSSYADVAVEVTRELAARIEVAVAGGIDRARILVDPGIGFAKTAEQSLELLSRLPILGGLGCRILLGLSRKSFLGRAGGIDLPQARPGGAEIATQVAWMFPDRIERVHDVAAARLARRIGEAVISGGRTLAA